jgi:hypothetical protein
MRSKAERRWQRQQDASRHERRPDGSRARAHKWWHCSAKMAMSGWLNGGNFTGVTMRAQSRGDLGEDGPDRWDRAEMRSLTGGPADASGPLCSDGGDGSGRGLASRRTGPDDTIALGRPGGKRPSKIFPF